jgi:pimeloyl-ACP methyl ester carboxylesterase
MKSMISINRSILPIFFLCVIFFNSQSQPIKEEKFVLIGGIEQWITIKGANLSNPVILFVLGGRGSVLSPYSEVIFNEWENDFILVNWDQRGAGRTFGRNAPDEVDEDFWKANPLSLDEMVEDGIEVTEYLIEHLGKQKVILIGTSWGSILGTKMVLKNPDLFYAYIGHSQIVSFNENLKFAHKKAYSLAKNTGDTTTVSKLESLGEPPYSDARDLGQMLRSVKKYESENASHAPAGWWDIMPEYDNEIDNRDRYNGDDYSFLYFARHEKFGIKPMAADVDFNKDGTKFTIPVFIIQGEHDILTSKEISKPFFDNIKAPEKEYFLIFDAAHGFNQSVIDQQFQILKEYVLRAVR